MKEQSVVGEQCGLGHGHFHKHGMRWITWSAIFTGAFVGLGLSFLLNLFSVAIGLTVFTVNQSGLLTLAIGGFIGLIIGGAISMFVAGWVSGLLGKSCCYKHNLGVLYGFTTWSLMLVLTVLLTAHLGGYLTSYSNFLTNPSSIVVTTNQAAPTVSTSSNTVPPQQMIINAEKATNTIGLGAMVVFIIFLIGALASCFGGYAGMACKRNAECDDRMN